MRDYHLPGRSPVLATEGMCATSHPLAANAAIDIMKRGGNAMDAAIAGAVLLGICEPQMTGIGGDCFVLFNTPGSDDVKAFNGSGRAPAAASADDLRADGHETRAQPLAPASDWADDGTRRLLDVRGPGEWEAGHLPGADNHPLPRLVDALDDVPRQTPLAVVCQTGYRSAAAASLLVRAGFTDVLYLTGGTAAWIEAGRPVERPAPA